MIIAYYPACGIFIEFIIFIFGSEKFSIPLNLGSDLLGFLSLDERLFFGRSDVQ